MTFRFELIEKFVARLVFFFFGFQRLLDGGAETNNGQGTHHAKAQHHIGGNGHDGQRGQHGKRTPAESDLDAFVDAAFRTAVENTEILCGTDDEVDVHEKTDDHINGNGDQTNDKVGFILI